MRRIKGYTFFFFWIALASESWALGSGPGATLRRDANANLVGLELPQSNKTNNKKIYILLTKYDHNNKGN